jgi:hypothetical protein
MRAYTITTKARAGGRGRMKRRIVPGGILALSLAVVLIGATASTASADLFPDRDLFLWCAPLPPTPVGCVEGHSPGKEVKPFDFGDRQVGTTSPAQGFELVARQPVGVYDDGDVLNPEISVSGDYAQTNNCAPTLSAIQGCFIRVTFTPTSTGRQHGTLSIGPGGPTATLTGHGVKHRTPPVLPLTLDASVRNGILGDATLGTNHGDASLKPERWKRGVVRGLSADTHIGHCFVHQCPDYDTKVVLRGDVKKTTKQLAANSGPAQFKARLKHLKQLKAEPTPPKIKIKFVATDEFGQTATEEGKVTLCSRVKWIDHHETVRCLGPRPRHKGGPK